MISEASTEGSHPIVWNERWVDLQCDLLELCRKLAGVFREVQWVELHDRVLSFQFIVVSFHICSKLHDIAAKGDILNKSIKIIRSLDVHFPNFVGGLA